MTTLTHQERAERVRELLRIPPNKTFRVTPGEWRYAMNIIAREMYPRELVEAAKSLLRIVEGEAMIRDRHGEEFAATEIHEARAVLSLYPKPEVGGDRP